MRTVVFVLVALLLVSTCFALESGPSNKVGYVKFTSVGVPGLDTYTPFGIPFVCWYVPTGNIPEYGNESYNPRDIIGTQIPCGDLFTTDMLMLPDLGYTGWRECPDTWAGDLVDLPFDPEHPENTGMMYPGAAFYWINSHGADIDFVIAGEADITGNGIPPTSVYGAPAEGEYVFVSYSWRDPRSLPRENLGLVEQGFTGSDMDYTSDQVWEQNGGRIFWYDEPNSRYAYSADEDPFALLTVEPGQTYWILNAHVGHTWTYTYTPMAPAMHGASASTSLTKAAAPASANQKLNKPFSKSAIDNLSKVKKSKLGK